MALDNISDWTKNINPPIFQNTYADGRNTLRYKGGGGHERIYYAITIPKSYTLNFSLRYCTPTGYTCNYGDSTEYIVIFGTQPSGTGDMTGYNILARTAVSKTASDTPVLYSTSYANSSDTAKTVYLGIDWGYITDGVEISLIYEDIQANLVFNGWYLEDNEFFLTNGKLADEIDSDLIVEPYPASFWYLDEHDNLTSMLLPEPINSATLVKPYPASFWYLEPELDSTLCAALLPDELYSGAFLGCANLTYVRIPSSVTRINDNAFYDTALTLVKLPTGCVYEKHAFPPDCEIQFYDV